MRSILAKVVLCGVGIALPLWAFGQVAPPVIPAVNAAPPARGHASTPVWSRNGTSVDVSAHGRAESLTPNAAAGIADARASSVGAGVRVTTKPGLTAHAKVDEIRWSPAAAGCAPGTAGCLGLAPVDGVQGGEVGAGFAGHGVKLDVSIGHAQSEASMASARGARVLLPRVLPATGAGDVAAPLWFRNSTSNSVSARGQLDFTPSTSVDVGASVGHVRFLPGSGLAADDTVDQTTLSLGIRHGAVRGAIVGHVLEPNLPGAALDQNQRWSGIDLGVSVRLPWRGQLNFGAQNVWSSGRSSLLFGSGASAPDQGRVPYVQYHQDL